jgi:hypothetical protein
LDAAARDDSGTWRALPRRAEAKINSNRKALRPVHVQPKIFSLNRYVLRFNYCFEQFGYGSVRMPEAVMRHARTGKLVQGARV